MIEHNGKIFHDDDEVDDDEVEISFEIEAIEHV